MKFKSLIFIYICLILFQLNGFVSASETIIYLTRHGETHWNVKKLWQGTSDTTLNLEGIHQAAEKAEFFKEMKVDAVYCSPLQRAYLTAQIIAAMHEKVATPRFGLIEPWLGKLQGMHADDIHALIDSDLNALSQEERRKRGDLEGLMSLSMVKENVETELALLAKMHPDGTIVTVSHSAVIKAIIAMHTAAIHETIKMSNMAYLKYSYDGEKLTLIEVSPDIKYNSYNL